MTVKLETEHPTGASAEYATDELRRVAALHGFSSVVTKDRREMQVNIPSNDNPEGQLAILKTVLRSPLFGELIYLETDIQINP